VWLFNRATIGIEPFEITGKRLVHRRLHRPKAGKQLLAEFRQRCAAPLLTAALRLDRRLKEHAVEVGNKQPRAAIGHIHGPTSCRNRPRFPYVFQKFDLPVPEPVLAGEAYSQDGLEVISRHIAHDELVWHLAVYTRPSAGCIWRAHRP
jgi:hypothetical protein